MIEKEYSQKEKFEIEDRLSKVRSYINSIIPKMDDEFFEKAGKSKESTKLKQVYYAGGTLCLDIVCSKEEAVFMLNISDETITIIVDGKETRRLMPIGHLLFAFTIYKEVKGFHKEYYRDCYKKSCIRHLYTMLMNKREDHVFNSKIEDLILDHFQTLPEIEF